MMRLTIVVVLAFALTTLPVILQSCCGGFGGDEDTYYDIDEMTVEIQGLNPTTTSSKLSDINFFVVFQVTYTSVESSGGSTLYACSPAPTISNQQVSAVTITSNEDLVTTTGTTQAGESLNFLFRVSGYSHNNDPVSNLIGNPLLERVLAFTTDVALSSEQTHIFTFKITLDDGRTFTLEAAELTLVQG